MRGFWGYLEQIANICNLVAEFFEGDPSKTVLWFKTPNPMLGNISPRDMIRYGRFKRLQGFMMEARETNQASAAETWRAASPSSLTSW